MASVLLPKTQIKMKCPHCQTTEHEPKARFCHICGASLKDDCHDSGHDLRTASLRFEWAESFSEGLALVGINGKTGFIDKTGRIVINPVFDPVGSFSFGMPSFCGFNGGLAAVSKGGLSGSMGCIDRSGSFVIQPLYDCIWPFSEDLAPFNKNGRWGFIDRKGTEVIPARYEFVEGFSEGFGVRENQIQGACVYQSYGQGGSEENKEFDFRLG